MSTDNDRNQSTHSALLAFVVLTGLLAFALTGCGTGKSITLGKPGQLTLVYIYTDN